MVDKEAYVFNSLLHSPKPLQYSEKGKIFGIMAALLGGEELQNEDKDNTAPRGVNYFNKGHIVSKRKILLNKPR